MESNESLHAWADAALLAFLRRTFTKLANDAQTASLELRAVLEGLAK